MKLKWLLPLLILLFPLNARATNAPSVIHRCSSNAQNGFTTTLNCDTHNVTAGNVLILDYYSASTGDTITATETFTCPAGSTASASMGGFQYRTLKCYVVLASSHTTFSVQIVVSGGAANIYTINVREFPVPGFGAVDAGSASNASNTLSVSVTTANSGEWIDAFCTDYANYLYAGSSFIQDQSGQGYPINSQNRRGFSEHQIAGGAGTYTASCNVNNSASLQQIVALAFQVSSPPALPPVIQGQECVGDSGNSGSAEQQCALSNVVSGNTVLIGWVSRGVAASINPDGGESSNCPAAASTSQTYGGQLYFIGSCYVVLGSSHSTFSAQVTGATGIVAWFLTMYEVSGLSTFDSGSGCSAAATSCSYTTAGTNEWSWMWAADLQGNPMIAGNSFDPTGSTQNKTSAVNQALVGIKPNTANGSNTCSYTETGSSQPLISCFAFAAISAGTAIKRSKGYIF